MPSTAKAGPLIARLQGAVHDVLSNVLPPIPLALVDFPNHSNVGDSAIWLGEINYFTTVHGRPPAYCASMDDYSAAKLREYLPEGAILIHGGGNFGTLWPAHQDFRIKLMEDFPDRQIIQLPQSIYFSDSASLAPTAAAIKRHGRFTLLVRDQPSLTFARSHFDCQQVLCPDMAFCIGQTPRNEPATDLLYLMRTDRERHQDLAAPVQADGSIITDWVAETRMQYWVTSLSARTRAVLSDSPADRVQMRYNAFAQNRYQRGVEILSKGRVVITDRLHAHIMSILLDIPHVVFDNLYGKIANFMASWTSEFETVRQASTMSEATAQARELLLLNQQPVNS